MNYLLNLLRRINYGNGRKSKEYFLKKLKELFIVKPILKIYTPSLLTVIKTDISNFILSVYLIQKYPDR